MGSRGYPAGMPFRIGILFAAIVCSGLGACAPGSSGERIRLDAGSLRWPYAPTAIRVHPISRIKLDRETGVAVVQARIEFQDPDGFSTRGVGKLTISLTGPSRDGVMLMSKTEWECDLNDLELNRQYYDEVTRTYQVTLQLTPRIDVPFEPRLRAVLVTPQGRTLSDVSGVRFIRNPSERLPQDGMGSDDQP